MDTENQPLLSFVETQPTTSNKKQYATVGLLAAGALFGGAVYHQSSLNATSSELATTTSSDKVDIYIIAEAFCPNCKEHSYLFDTLIMDKGEDMRDILDVKLDMMVYDGWDIVKDTGVCEKGKWDCEYAKYQMAVQEVYGDDQSMAWWDYSRCLYKSQNKMLAVYVEEGKENADYMNDVVSECATLTGLDASLIQDYVTTKGTYALHEAFGRTKEYSMPVWIYVNGKYIEYEDDWINAVCAAYSGDSTPAACTSAESLDGGHVAANSLSIFPDNDKVNVYIVAEAMCPNCKEHSYYLDKLVMTPEGVKSSVRESMNVFMEQMIIDGWNEKTDTGVCEKGKFDCELSKYHMCAQKIDDFSTDKKWWDYSRCLYEHQTEMIDYYYYSSGSDMALMTSVTDSCAAKTGVDATAISTCVSEEGTTLLKESYLRVGEMNDPVWIYVENQRIDYHDDWLATICAAMTGKGLSAKECNYYADVRK